ncbi:DUF6161 domain-containing protein [Microbulbifer magnicolonia]|uniref:DUF6161 domain-containing protein n=1 Tax=Microbulbifer magnicolonia TaxID=3109744 RepID=UPI002B416044|nr:DUF6161 domain-containing protein [Microbulbifer sp. GG15]
MNKNINVQFKDVTGKQFKFEGLRELREFLSGEVSYWREQHDEIAKSQKQFHGHVTFYSTLESAVRSIDGWLKKAEESEQEDLQGEMAELQRQLLRYTANSFLWSGHPLTAQYVEIHKQHNHAVASKFLDYVVKGVPSSLESKDGFLGAMYGYEFVHQDSDLVKRRNAERISLGHLRNQMEEATTKLIGEAENFKSEFKEWDESARDDWTEWTGEAQGQHSGAQDERRDEFMRFMDGCNTRIDGLEKTYEEKLRLAGPAEYWRKAGNRYGIQGGLWMLALIASVVLGLVYFSSYFNSWLAGKQIGIQLNTLQGVLMFGTVVAVYAFLVKTLSRLTFSAFHLMRDAQEREQLTYLYLALVNDKKIDEASRDLVLQSLFSRSESGLLAGESGPTMPTVGDMIRSVSAGK